MREFLGSIQAISAGELSIEAICEPAEKSIKTSLLVKELNREKLGNPTNPVPLQQLANLTRGLSKNYQEKEDLISALSFPPKADPIFKIFSLRICIGDLFFVLLAIYWTVENSLGWSRKMQRKDLNSLKCASAPSTELKDGLVKFFGNLERTARTKVIFKFLLLIIFFLGSSWMSLSFQIEFGKQLPLGELLFYWSE